MWRRFLPATLILLVAITSPPIMGQKGEKEIVGVTPTQVRWFTPAYYTDSRQPAQLYGDSSQKGPWIDRAKIPAGKHVAATLIRKMSWLHAGILGLRPMSH